MIITKENLELQRWLKWSKRLQHIPNVLALSRVFMAPLMFLFLVNRELFSCHESWCDFFGALVFTLASITDFFDGYIARNFDATSKLASIVETAMYLATEPKPGQLSVTGKSLSTVLGMWMACIGYPILSES